MLKHLSILLNLLIITTLAYSGVDTMYKVAAGRLVTDSPAVFEKAQVESGQPARSIRPYKDYKKAVVNRDLFHTIPPKIEAAPTKPAPEPLKLTSLKLKLLGTITGSPKYARAIIEDQKKRDSGLYRIGDEVEGAKLDKIEREQVVLLVNGRPEILTMDKDSRDNRGRAAPLVRPPRDGSDITVQRGDVQKALRNINQLMTQVNVRPHFEDGEPAGLMLRRIKPNSIFQEMGLKDGDIIQGVNESDIEQTDDVLSLYEQLKNSDEVALQIKRGGQPTTINYKFE